MRLFKAFSAAGVPAFMEELTIAEKNEAIRKFKAGEIQYLIANPASLTKA